VFRTKPTWTKVPPDKSSPDKSPPDKKMRSEIRILSVELRNYKLVRSPQKIDK
jgi:hypothetical protein